MTKGAEFARVGPVHFQPLSMEVNQIRAHVKGHTLNAGCGNRDISELLKGMGSEQVVNYDIESSIPNAILGSLENTPFSADFFDTIFCNAVLEHVPNISVVMSELARILKPNGKLIVGMPFLQPFHLSPTDYRRFTRDGLIELGELHGLSHLEILPVHNICQTLGWIAWEWAREKRKRHRIVVYPIVWLATRIFYRTDFSVTKNVNTFQIVYEKK